MTNTEWFDIEKFKLKTFPYTEIPKHTIDCLHLEDGPCTCGLEEILQDEILEEILQDESFEEAPKES